MKNTVLIFCMVALAFQVSNAQNTRKIRYRADIGLYDEAVLPGAQRLIGNVAFAQDNVRGYCDSAYLYDKENYIVAFGNRVKIYVGDSVRLYGHRAYYDGNAKMASIADYVTLENGNAVLFTDSLTYDLNKECGYYLTGGRMINGTDTLTSRRGYYYTNSDDAFVQDKVLLCSPTYRMDCQSLQYNTAAKKAYFISKTHLISEDNEIFTDGGQYDTQKDISVLVGNVQLFNKSQTMYADSIYYDRNSRFGRGWNKVTIFDTVQHYVVQGNYVEHYETGGFSVATDSTLLILIDENNDSLFLHSDTLKILFDGHQDPQLILAYHQTKFFRNDLQGACDSLTYVVEDSVVTMYFNPAVWSDDYQLTGDTIRFTMLDSVNTKVELCKSGFIVGGLFGATEFNQIKGVNITGLIQNNKLYQVDIINNAECVYYIQEEDNSLIGINTSLTNEMRILLDSNKISQIRFYDAPDGHIYPDEKFEDKDRKLQDFRWLDEYRPKTVFDLYSHAIPRVKVL